MKNHELLCEAASLAAIGCAADALSRVYKVLNDPTLENRTDAVDLLKTLSGTNHLSKLNYARALMLGDGCLRSPETAVLLLEAVSLEGETYLASVAHGMLAEIALGTDRNHIGSADIAKALWHFELSAQLGNATGAFNAGLLHASGRGIAQAYEKAEEMYRKAVDFAHVAASRNLATMIVLGHASGNIDEAMALYVYAAEAGDGAARYLADYLSTFADDDGSIDEAEVRAIFLLAYEDHVDM